MVEASPPNSGSTLRFPGLGVAPITYMGTPIESGAGGLDLVGLVALEALGAEVQVEPL